MTRTKRFVTEPSRSPLQSRAGVLLNLIFPDLRRPAASSKRNQAKTAKLSAPAAAGAAAAASASASATSSGSSGQQQADGSNSPAVARSCSPTLAGCSSSHQQLPASLLHLESLDADDIGGLSDLLDDDDDEADQLTLPGVQQTAAAAAASEQQQRSNVNVPGGSSPSAAAAAAAAAAAVAASSSAHEAEQHAAVDGTALIVEHPAAAAAAGPAEEADGFSAVDKMLEQLSVDVMLDQQYHLEEQQRNQRQSPTGPSSSINHAASANQQGAGMPYPTGPAAAAAAAGASTGAPATPLGSHQVPINVAAERAADAAADLSMSQPLPLTEGQQQQLQQCEMLPPGWQLQQSFSAPVVVTHTGTDSAAGQQEQHVSHNMSHDSSDRPFSFQDLMMSDEMPHQHAASSSRALGMNSQHQHLPQQQQQQQMWPAYNQPQPLHSVHSAPAPLAAAAPPPYHPQGHPSYPTPAGYPTQPPPLQQQQHWQQRMTPHQHAIPPNSQPPIPFYNQQQQQYSQTHSHPHPQQQQQAYPSQQHYPGPTAAAGLHHSVSPHQAELEALKQQIAEEKRRRKERKQLKKMRKIMLQQQQQQQQGLAHQVLYAASSQPPLLLPSGSSPRPRGLPHAPWPPTASQPLQQQQQQMRSRYPGMQPDAPQGVAGSRLAGPYGAPYHSSNSSSTGGRGAAALMHHAAGSPPGAAAAAAAAASRQHAVAQSLRQLAQKSEQMQRAGITAARELPPPADRRSQTPVAGGVGPGGGSSSSSAGRHGGYAAARPPMPYPEPDAYMRNSSISSSNAPGAAAAAGSVVLDLQHSDTQQQQQQQQQQQGRLRVGSFNGSNSPDNFSRGGMQAMPDTAAEDTPAGVAGCMNTGPTAAAAAAAGSSPPVGRGFMGFHLRSHASAPQPAAARYRGSSETAVVGSAPTGRDVLAAAGAGAPRAASADAADTYHSSGTKIVGQLAADYPAAAAEGATASPVSNTSSSGRKRSWQQAASAGDVTMSSGYDTAAHPIGRNGSSNGLQAMSCDQPDQQQQQPQQRQQRLLQLPFNGPDLAERRPLVTTEPPAVAKPAHHHQQQQQPAANTQQDAPGTSSKVDAIAASVDPADDLAAATAADQAGPAATATAAAVLHSPDISSMCTSSDNTFQRPKAIIGQKAAKAPRGADSCSASSSSRARGEAAGLTSPGLSSGLGRQQSFSEATAAAAAAAAAAAVGSSGGSGDLSGYLGAYGNPGVYRTSSGKVLRMLTHPVTGKPLLLGLAVDAKSSRLGNTSLGAPAPQLFGMDLQSTHLNSLPAPIPQTPMTLSGYAQAATPGLTPAAAAAAAVPGFSSPSTSSSIRSRQLGFSDTPGAGSSAMPGAAAAAAGGYGAAHAQAGGYNSMPYHQGAGLSAGSGAPGSAAAYSAGVAFGGGAALNSSAGMYDARQQHAGGWGQQQQQHGLEEDGLIGFEQLQQQYDQFGDAVPMDFAAAPGVSQGMTAMPGFGFGGNM